MSKFLGYALAFGIGFGAAKILRWKPISDEQQTTPGSCMTVKGA